MCSSITYKTKDFYFGRTFDYDYSYGENIVISPRNYVFKFKEKESIKSHYAIIGMAYVVDNYPLYYDACNEKGLCIAGLNFTNNASYNKAKENFDNIAQFELIPWILCKCATCLQAKKLIKKLNLIDTQFNKDLKVAQLHWMIADKNECIVLECVNNKINIYDNPVGVLTNNPPFNIQLFNLNNYMNLSIKNPKNSFSNKIQLSNYSQGMGAYGLPGDLSSSSRFIRASFIKLNSSSLNDNISSLNQLFHILNSVEQVNGVCMLDNNKYEKTIYSSCINASKCIYYYTTYNNHQISAIDMNNENLDSNKLIMYDLIDQEQLFYQN